MKANLWLIVGGLIVGGVIVWGIVHAVTAAVEVDAATAQVERIREFVDERAKTRLPQTYLITMPFSGRIEAIAAQEGEAVRTTDDYVARIVPSDLELAVEQARAAYERLEASIAENDDVTVEGTAEQQALEFVKSMLATVEAARARVDSGEARLGYARTDYERTEQLFRTKARTQDDLDLARVRLVEGDVDFRQDKLVHAAMLAMKAATDLMPTMVRQYIKRKLEKAKEVLVKQKAEAKAQLDKVQQDFRRGTIQSPVDGVVLRRFVTDERYLSAGESLLEIGRLEDLEIEADVLSVDVVDVKVGDAVEIYGPAVGRPHAWGTVRRIFPAGFTKISSLGVEQQRVKVIIQFDEGQRERLVAERHLEVGYRVRVKIYTAEDPQALVVPRSALFRATDGRSPSVGDSMSPSQWAVYAVRGGRARIQQVTVGLINDEKAQITDGLAPGDRVVLAPESNLTDGARVAVRQTKDRGMTGDGVTGDE